MADLKFRTLVVDVGFWAVMAYFGLWPLVANYLQIIDIVKRRRKLLKHSEYFFIVFILSNRCARSVFCSSFLFFKCIKLIICCQF